MTYNNRSLRVPSVRPVPSIIYGDPDQEVQHQAKIKALRSLRVKPPQSMAFSVLTAREIFSPSTEWMPHESAMRPANTREIPTQDFRAMITTPPTSSGPFQSRVIPPGVPSGQFAHLMPPLGVPTHPFGEQIPTPLIALGQPQHQLQLPKVSKGSLPYQIPLPEVLRLIPPPGIRAAMYLQPSCPGRLVPAPTPLGIPPTAHPPTLSHPTTSHADLQFELASLHNYLERMSQSRPRPTDEMSAVKRRVRFLESLMVSGDEGVGTSRMGIYERPAMQAAREIQPGGPSQREREQQPMQSGIEDHACVVSLRGQLPKD